jgi:hypothetical protein
MLARLDKGVKKLYIYGQVMGLRGPKPVIVDHLKGHAIAWASFFYTLRDGQSGQMQRVKWGRVRNTGSAKWTGVTSGMGTIAFPAGVKYRESTPLGPPIVIPVSEAARALPRKMRAKDWVVSRPTMPAPDLWVRIRQASSVEEVRKASREIRKWMDKQFGPVGRWLPGSPPLEFCDALDAYAEQVLLAKRLPSYAKTNRPSSDDKRIQLLAKTLAGARYGIAPMTAAKRLSHWHLPRDWAEKALHEYMEWSKKQFRDHDMKEANKG